MKERTKLALRVEAVMISVCLVITAMCLLCSCSAQERIVTIEKVKTDTTYITKQQRDSIWLHDSIQITERGDTIRIERWHTKYVSKEVHDTLYRAKVDSIPVPYEVIKEVPANLSKTQRGLMLIGIAALMALIIFGAIRLKRFLP